MNIDGFKIQIDDVSFFQDDKYSDSEMIYTLPYRLTEFELIDKCSKTFEEAKNEFLDKLTITRQLFEENIQTCRRIDSVFGE